MSSTSLFWEEALKVNDEKLAVREFVADLFHYALESYFHENETMKYLLGDKLDVLRNKQLSSSQLAALL